MPSEPAVVSQNSSPDVPTPQPTTSFQHGNDDRCDEPVFDTLLREDVGDQVASSDPPVSAPAGAHASEDALLRRLNGTDDDVAIVSSPSSVPRGVETENSLEDVFRSSPGSHQSKVYVLRPKPRQTLAELPNEVLTHILSHLTPAALTAIAFVSRRFHTLVTTPHAWRTAFGRYFPGPYSIGEDVTSEGLDSSRRSFTRLTALASWRSEYILRTRLLRSLGRGKPAVIPSSGKHNARAGGIQSGSALATYTSQLLYPITHIDALFTPTNAKKSPLFIHGAAEEGVASMSDPSAGKTGPWGLYGHPLFNHFTDLYSGEAEYGLGAGDMVGVPNSMDVSQPYGMIYGEGCPRGRSYFVSSDEKRGRFLGGSELHSEPALGIPDIQSFTTGVSSVWIARSPNILKITNNIFGILCGSTSGVLTAYSLGSSLLHERRFDPGQITARWVLSPGVPIISISVDENFSEKRYSTRRIWATVLNALGEVYYLTELPTPPESNQPALPEVLERRAWKAGRSVRWELIESTRRVARPDPFNRDAVDGSYSPRSSTDSMGLSESQIAAETREIEKYLAFKPKHFRKVCEGWDMQRRLKVDFAGDDLNGAGEQVFIISCGFDQDQSASVRRHVRQKVSISTSSEHSPKLSSFKPVVPSLFGGPTTPQSSQPTSQPRSRAASHASHSVSTIANTEWKATDFVFGGPKFLRLTSAAMDMSSLAQLTVAEDPLLGMSSASNVSSPASSPLPCMQASASESGVPGQRARFLAVGTDSGSVYVWNMRVPPSRTPGLINTVSPVRIIQTESPQVSCLGLTSLYLVHGGNDGLVQAWDPLASTLRPIRTLHSRFSSRARRRLIQAEASILGVGNNYFAAGAICLDPDPTVLRGIVSLGTHVRFWSYSSSAADEYKTSKRRRRRSHRGSNSSSEGQRFTSTGRGALKDFIEDEHHEMKRQIVEDEKQREHLSYRFGTDLLGPDATEEELIAYAQLLSEESLNDAFNQKQSGSNTRASSVSSDTVAAFDSSYPPREFSSSSSPALETVEEELAPDIAEAIRLSLLDETPHSPNARQQTSSPPSFNTSSIPIKYAKGAKSKFKRRQQSSSPPETAAAESSNQQEMDDLEFAIQLSLAEEQSRENSQRQLEQEFPSLYGSSAAGKGKGRAQ
ncbi:F-box and WD domain protein [Talaromyces stipitatus ATCC 10500]|uniref:F-box and WD domain protein n=1 Tax=Talaromyces stipitatus (strain ATCC 10500 / CBS 375.48 / QM 6759 / NRRL 1006) TaxID=441959 RepID=B8MEN8_TALSN|nr:F-box and WD domain protein [Talaromyces stipitatus ATCC 10500]XP_002484156.1 F-box and WD domain protein [Talaromyces stipitatus ATCC 10500]EED16921.1 F-box and WD domain protein [Talaromyces stipitatus ATCC 10500]EED16922.1 F-box and WD domain protein [Talaromyces stipitatus ATCC 10500]